MSLELKRVISLHQAILYGTGVIVGAGIFSMIGVAAGIAGNAVWISFAIAAVIALFTALSYSELTHRYPKEAAESVYVLSAIKSKKIAFSVGFLAFLTAIISAATVMWGFASYFKLFVSVDALIIAVAALFALSAINYVGIKESVSMSNGLSIITIFGLVVLIIFGLSSLGTTDLFLGINGIKIWENSFSQIPTLFAAAALIFFAYLGFEEIANITEEMKNARKNAPKAILYALLITTVIYILIAAVSVSVSTPAELANAANPLVPLTEGPLALVAEKAIGTGAGFWFSILALFATASTTVVLLNVASRVLYGMANEGLMPKFLSHINPQTHTPNIAISSVVIISLILTAIGNIELLGAITTSATFLLFFSVNASLILIKKRENEVSWAHRNLFGWIPIPALFGAIFCFGMFVTQYWGRVDIFGAQIPLIVIPLGLILLGTLIYTFFSRKNNL